MTESIFIDRDPELFGYILNYLRNGNIEQLNKYCENRVDLMHEFEFFGLNIKSDNTDNKDNNTDKDYIKINVGGTIFSTNKLTLHEMVYFNCNDRNHNRDDDGNIFLDRDPRLFSIILNYLRNKNLEQLRKHCVKENNLR